VMAAATSLLDRLQKNIVVYTCHNGGMECAEIRRTLIT
jgi:hypothetical protein